LKSILKQAGAIMGIRELRSYKQFNPIASKEELCLILAMGIITMQLVRIVEPKDRT